MLPLALNELRSLYRSVPELIEALSKACGRDETEVKDELERHLALRLLFQLVGSLETAPNYPIAHARLASLLGRSDQELRALSAAIADVRLALRAADTDTKAGINALSYVDRQNLLRA